MAGFAVGVVVGMALAIVMQRFAVAERGLLPYVVLSQTVPLVALAPLVVGWGGNLTLLGVHWKLWMSVAVIAAYLAFFPVAVGGLRGLQAPTSEAVELMDSYAASWRRDAAEAAPAGRCPLSGAGPQAGGCVVGGGRGGGRDLHRDQGRHRAAHHRVLP